MMYLMKLRHTGYDLRRNRKAPAATSAAAAANIGSSKKVSIANT